MLIAGPSSSGKTSTAQRLSIQMAVNGLRPIAVSMDDYYKNRVDSPRKADGSYDLNVWRLSTWSCSTIICSVCWLVKSQNAQVQFPHRLP